MTDVAAELLSLLDIEQLEVDLFRGIGAGGETSKRIYGGQVIAQALAAAYGTVPDRLCHSLHAYFIRPGDPSIPVIYQVDRARDGGSFTTRRVVAIQHGKQILNMSASFHVEEEGWDYQHVMPEVPGPEGLLNREELRDRWAPHVPEHLRRDFLRPRPIEIREVAPRDLVDPKPESDINHLWFRMEAAAGASPQLQHILLAYASDMNLLGSSLRPHGLTWFTGEVMTASLDHSMWFHGPLAFEDWHLYSMDAPFTGGARGFNRGKIYARDGRLVASTAQEGLVRPYKRK
ncbi:acyl-CoA thioesterase [Antarcticimicrobium luteum]|uniref:Acyl-CoA thioesterase 2 n=1 Tax=Antarcticimicrobium luteum TaxID=2547397 RepID=A0A4R5V083_9RHOB|nr:acyl-CoA thioesterase II [Antarcticimicrobium luteum]TDK45099.1 acyl-CoA thioesterase II [Antarcticimicrobium luteum]